jgi:hypothetical protein
MRTLLACTLLLALSSLTRPARADLISIKPGLELLQSYGPRDLDGGPRDWQDNRGAGFALELGHPFGPHDVALSGHLFPHNHGAIFFLALYRYHFGDRDQLHLFAGGGPGIGCINHRDYHDGGGESDTCSGGWHLAAGGGVWMPLHPHLALTGELLALGSGPSKAAFTPMLSASVVVNL